jgi:hypothetical protein
VAYLEIDWDNYGYLSFWIDGTQQAALTGINNSRCAVESVRLGSPYVTGSVHGGAYCLDAFESRRTSYIGLLGASSAGRTGTVHPLSASGHFASYSLPQGDSSESLVQNSAQPEG